jgi:hypothetical protein
MAGLRLSREGRVKAFAVGLVVLCLLAGIGVLLVFAALVLPGR